MPATIEIPANVEGMTLTLSAYPDASDTAAVTGVALTEATNRKSYYTGSVNLSGLHFLRLLSGSSTVATKWGFLATSGTVHAYDSRIEALYATSSDSLLAAIQALRIRKNVAIAAFPFKLVSSVNHSVGVTGATVTATRSLDGAAFGACANSVSEVGGGIYKLNLGAADLNGDTVVLRFTATGCDTLEIGIVSNNT